MVFNMIFKGLVKKGNNKQECDDTALIGESIINNESINHVGEDVFIVGVADGVGGNAGGKEASLFLSDRLSKLSNVSDENDIKSSLYIINKDLIKYALDYGKPNMATTFTGLVFINGRYILIHIGNTRLYIRQGSYLKQITQDHTMQQWLINHGQIDAADNCNKNEITSCFGGGREDLLKELVVKGVFENGLSNLLLLTSDGIHDYIDIDKIEEIVNNNDDEHIIEELIKESEKNGSVDDKTIIIMRT